MRVNEPYNRFSGQSLEHLTALTDGLFAVAMTLLVLDLRVPAAAAYSEHGLGRALAHLGPSFAAYLLSFTMLGTFWLAVHTLLPFTAALLAHYVHLRLAVGLYWLNILLLGVTLEWAARHGRRAFLPGAGGPAGGEPGATQPGAGVSGDQPVPGWPSSGAGSCSPRSSTRWPR